MKSVLFFARDPGGANAIIPLIKAMEDTYIVTCYAKDYALSRMLKEDIKCVDINTEIDSIEEENVFSFLEGKNVDILVTGTSLDDYTERYLWRAAKALGIFSVAVIDQWMNLGIRFSNYDYTQKELFEEEHTICYLPDKIFVMDELAKKIMIEDGVPETNICVTGQPHFDIVKERYDSIISLKEDKDIWNVIFVSEPIIKDYDGGNEFGLYWGFNEQTIFNELYESLLEIFNENKQRIRCIVRPHPREDVDSWKDIFIKYKNDNIILECDAKTDTFELLHKADVVCGMSSMFLLESIICNVPTISILIGLKQKTPFVLDKVGKYKSIKDRNTLITQLNMIKKSEDRMIEFDIIQNATDKAMACIEEEVK